MAAWTRVPVLSVVPPAVMVRLWSAPSPTCPSQFGKCFADGDRRSHGSRQLGARRHSSVHRVACRASAEGDTATTTESRLNEPITRPTKCPVCHGTVVDTLAKTITMATLWGCALNAKERVRSRAVRHLLT